MPRKSRRKTLSLAGIGRLSLKPTAYASSDPECTGHWIRVHPSGSKTSTVIARDPTGKQVWATMGPTNNFQSIDDMRDAARKAIARIKRGDPAHEVLLPRAQTFGEAAEAWIKRHLQADKVKSEGEYTRLVRSELVSDLRDRPLPSIKRTDVVRLLNAINDAKGPRKADEVLLVVSAIMKWHAKNGEEDYVAPNLAGLRRVAKKDKVRKRALNDDEIRLVWQATEGSGTYNGIVRTCLLTAARLGKVITMKWDDLSPEGVWTIATESRDKPHAGQLKLSTMSYEVILNQPRTDCPFVFPGVFGKGHYNSLSQGKRELDERLPPDLPGWRVHDLRRTARTLMSRKGSGIDRDTAERVLGHIVGNEIERTYDVDPYLEVKADALQRLADMLEMIVNPPPVGSNVLTYAQR
jgi:integrase